MKTIPLAKLNVLVLDCQATTPNPENGFLLEMGWYGMHGCDVDETGIESYLCKPKEEEEVPRRVSRITGLKTDDLNDGLPPEKIWKKLLKAAGKVRAANNGKFCPVIIHFARFEEPYLRYFHRLYSPKRVFPFEIICTHEVTRRLLPKLPRKGLRAAAGYLGHSVPELRRSAHHTAATAFIWQRIVQLLEEQGVTTFKELMDWLATPPRKAGNSAREYPMPPGLRLNLPHQPGVYRMLRSNGDLLYIGKAASLKHRVNSYFHKKKGTGHAEHTLEMLTQANGLEVTVTGSALEAALLETDEIKKHSPPYNIALRKRDREIVFFSRDLQQSAQQADDDLPIGPLPSKEALVPAAVLLELLGSRRKEKLNPGMVSSALGTLPDYTPDEECFGAGLKLFQERHMEMLNKLAYDYTFNRHPVAAITTLGRVFHLKRLEELALAASRGEEAEVLEETGSGDSIEVEEEVSAEWEWTPDAVANAVESIIRRGAHMIRRGRWFCLLSESSLAWDTGERAGGGRRVLVFRSGGIVYRENLAGSGDIPLPPGSLRPFAVRRRNFDVMVYDRMRVLTTELRRLVSYETNRNIELRLGPHAVLGREALLKALAWV